MEMNHIWQHPIFKGMIGVAAFVVVAEFMVLFIPLAWAVSVPITDRITIELGELPQWIIALVAFGGLWKAWKAEQKAGAAVTTAAVGVAKIEAVSVQIDGLLAERDKAKVIEGETKGKKAGEDAAVQLAEGQRQGREIERESVAAQGTPTGAAPAAAAAIPGKQPLPVADERTAQASERVATATERSAAATARVADATEVKLADGKK